MAGLYFCANFAGVHGEFCQHSPEPIFFWEKKKKSPTNVLGVKIFVNKNVLRCEKQFILKMKKVCTIHKTNSRLT